MSHRPSREVRIERWNGRAFYVVPCPFRVDLPLDMSGCIAAALRDTAASGHRRSPAGAILASDARRGGAIFVEVEPLDDDPLITWIEGDVLARVLPSGPAALRHEVEELLRWSNELGHEISSFYVGFAPGHTPRSFHPVRLFAALEGGSVVEHFEVRGSKRSLSRVA